MFGLRPVFAGSTSASSSGALLDTLAVQPTVAVGLELQRTAYAGKCVRIHSTISAPDADYGFTGGMFDSEAARVVLAADSNAAGTVAKWYCQQAGGTAEFVQATAGSQPVLFTAGPPTTYTGSLGFFFGGPRSLTATISPGASSQFMLSMAVDTIGVNANCYAITYQATGQANDDSPGSWYLFCTGSGGYGLSMNGNTGGTDFAQVTGVSAGKHVLTAWHTGTSINFQVDGGTVSSNATTTTIGSSGTLTIGARTGNTNGFLGGIASVLLWPSYNASDKAAALAWFRSKYGTP